MVNLYHIAITTLPLRLHYTPSRSSIYWSPYIGSKVESFVKSTGTIDGVTPIAITGSHTLHGLRPKRLYRGNMLYTVAIGRGKTPELIKRTRLYSQLLLDQIHFSRQHTYQLGIRQCPDAGIFIMSAGKSIKLGSRQAGSAHHHPIEIVITRYDIVHHLRRCVQPAPKYIKALAESSILLTKNFFSRSLPHIIYGCNNYRTCHTRKKNMPRLPPQLLCASRIYTFVAISGRIIAVIYFFTHRVLPAITQSYFAKITIIH